MLRNMYRDVWDNLVLADEWRQTIITPLYKNKGSRKDPKNYRRLSISSKLAVLMAIMQNNSLPISTNIVRSTPPCMHKFNVYEVSILKITKH